MGDTPQPESVSASRRWLLSLRAVAGGLSLGMVLDYFKTTHPMQTFTIASAVVFVLLVGSELYRLPPRAPLIPLVTRACLWVSVLGALVVIFAPTTWTPYAVLVTATFGIAGALRPAPLPNGEVQV